MLTVTVGTFEQYTMLCYMNIEPVTASVPFSCNNPPISAPRVSPTCEGDYLFSFYNFN
jgi:hypothetical protein